MKSEFEMDEQRCQEMSERCEDDKAGEEGTRKHTVVQYHQQVLGYANTIIS